ncbi:MAG: FG-GAP repeat protein [Planctomycetes bacterium]|nr:FG-GAP repeat protein [Planctomycetota bacterium]
MRTAGRSTPDEAIWAMSVQAQETDMRHLMPLLAAAASVLSTAPAYADLGDQLAKLLPDDGAANDWFGVSVAISGTTAIVGAFLDDDNGFSSAYLLETSTGRLLGADKLKNPVGCLQGRTDLWTSNCDPAGLRCRAPQCGEMGTDSQLE